MIIERYKENFLYLHLLSYYPEKSLQKTHFHFILDSIAFLNHFLYSKFDVEVFYQIALSW